jgi:hypothetical protein
VSGGDDLRGTSLAATVPAWQRAATEDREGTTGRFEAAASIDSYLETIETVVLEPIYAQGRLDVLVCGRNTDGDCRVNVGYIVPDRLIGGPGDHQPPAIVRPRTAAPSVATTPAARRR